MIFRKSDYVKGVICHEIIEFTTKWNVWQEHKGEIKKPEDVNQVLRKYLKADNIFYPSTASQPGAERHYHNHKYTFVKLGSLQHGL